MKSIGKIVLLLAVVKLIFSMAVATAFDTSSVKKIRIKILE